MKEKYFKDRNEAGQKLAQKLLKYRGQNPIVLALPRGGVPVGFEVAKALGALLDIFVSRKLGAPGNPEFGIGAVAQGGVIVIDKKIREMLAVTEEELQDIITKETAEVERRMAIFRGSRHNPQVQGKTVILVDDGLATGVTAQAAVRSLRMQEPKKLVLAVPVCAQDTAQRLRAEVDDFVCLEESANFSAVGQWYENFEQLSDQDVINILQRSHHSIIV